MAKPLVIDLFCGLGGWSRAFLDEGWDAIGFDIERHDYGAGGYPGQLVLQDVLTLDGRQFRGRASLIVASPPCQEFSYMAMPWSRGRQIAAALRGEADFPENYEGSRTVEELCVLFNACFRIAGEARIPLVVENVKGAQPWAGPARANFGSFFFWGDIGQVGNRITRSGPLQFGQAAVVAPGRTGGKRNSDGTDHPQGSWFKIANSKNRGGRKGPGGDWFEEGRQGQDACAEGLKVPGFRFDGSGKSFQSASVNGTKTQRHANKRDGHGHTRHLTNQRESDGFKVPGINFFEVGFNVAAAREIGPAMKPDGFERTEEMKRQHLGYCRKAASAMIAMIPYPIAQHIARVFKP